MLGVIGRSVDVHSAFSSKIGGHPVRRTLFMFEVLNCWLHRFGMTAKLHLHFSRLVQNAAAGPFLSPKFMHQRRCEITSPIYQY